MSGKQAKRLRQAIRKATEAAGNRLNLPESYKAVHAKAYYVELVDGKPPEGAEPTHTTATLVMQPGSLRHTEKVMKKARRLYGRT